MMYQFHELLDPYRHNAANLSKFSKSEKLQEMLAILRGCGYTSEDTKLLKDAVELSSKTLEFERRMPVAH